jgi:hypothetical protein
MSLRSIGAESGDRSITAGGVGTRAGVCYQVGECLRTILGEEFEHRRYAERDLATLAARTVGGAS